MSGASNGVLMCCLPETSSDGGGCSPSEEFQTAQETLFLSSQELKVNLSGRVVNDHYKELKASCDVSTEYVKTVDLGKDSDPGFSQVNSLSDKSFSPIKEFLVFSSESSFVRQKTSREILDLQSMRVDGTGAPGASVDDVAGQSGDCTLGENIGLLKPKFGEIISLKCGVTREITVGNSIEESPAKKRKQSKDYQIGTMNATHGTSTSPLEAMHEDPEMDIPREPEVCINEESGSSKKTSKRQSMLEPPLEEFQTAEKTPQINPQEQMMNSPCIVVQDQNCDVSTEHIETVDLGKDSGDLGFWGACVDNVAKRIEDSALGKTRGLFKQKIEETVSLQCGGAAGEITVGNSTEESLAEKRKRSEDYQFGEVSPPVVPTSPLKAMDKDPEIDISGYMEICSNAQRVSSKNSKCQSMLETPLEEFQTAEETLQINSQEKTMNSPGRVVEDHHCDVSTEHIETVDLGKDSVNTGLWGACVGNVAKGIEDSALGKTIGLFKQKIEETVTLQRGGAAGEITGGNSMDNSPAEKTKRSEDYQFGAVNPPGVSTSPLKAVEKDPEIDISGYREIWSNAERGSSKKNSKCQSMLETPLEEFQTAEETLQINSQEKTMNSPGRVVEDHHCDISTEHIETVDLGKDSGNTGLWGACVDNVAKGIEDSALGKTIGLFKQKIEETVTLQRRGAAGEITGGDSMDNSLAEKTKRSEDYQFGAVNPPGVSISPLKAMDKDPEIDISRYREICSNAERGSSKKTSKGRSTCKNAPEDAKGWCELPASIQGPMQSAAKHLVPDNCSSENQSLESLMDTIFELSGKNNATTVLRNDDILETAKQRGIKFPRPRWWPLEGF